ncbi:glutathione synthase [Paraferrimonas sedimenticola]|uniref:Glutathione synthetase n=1 Tax=Paraferrimonas sedimenticola TaxID=375674 RepID=A0AA37RVC8_9GAMM|nr:glutathione synthase [Paraferrimonas sedimenticola]GLP95579.1 glutathione synthetase [Paraferrimonas sedimenticola]
MLKLGIVMDPISDINIKKDTSFAMLLAAQARGYQLYYMEMQDLHLRDGKPFADMRELKVQADPNDWYSLGEPQSTDMVELDAVLMRKDPPFDTEFIYATYLLERAEEQGVLIVNKPQSLRDANEKLFTAWFSEFTPTTLVTRSQSQIRSFIDEFGDVILKPLDGMGGASIFRVKQGDPNIGVIIETLTEHQTRYAMAQRFIPQIDAGDKRILVVDGQPMPYCLARIPAKGETRGNIAAGGRGVAQPLSDSDWAIANAIGPELKKRGLMFVGLDVIGDKLTEINVTSPTCLVEIEAAYGISITDALFDAIETQVKEN